MLKKLNRAIDNIQNPVEYNMDPYKSILKDINKIKLDNLSDDDLKEISQTLKEKVQSGASLDNLLVEAFALVREASVRVLKIRPYDLQIFASIAIYQGKIAEMKTGEGKTLAAVMPAYLRALSGKGVHILTFNDYLAGRDAMWMGPLFEFLGLTVGYIKESMDIKRRQKAYNCDITYVTAKEAGFDYLRDFLCDDRKKLVHRSFNYAIIDEADSIMIDEARIPLVIAGDINDNSEDIFYISNIVKSLKDTYDYEIDQYGKKISLTDKGLMKVEKILGIDNLYDEENLNLLTQVNCALHAQFLLQKDKDYIIRDGRIEIIDEFTGRIADSRHWPDNLQKSVEAKEGINSNSKGKIIGSIPLQYFLSLYNKISGMTGTAALSSAEFRDYYCLDVVVIPTNRPYNRKDHPSLIYTHKEAKIKALISEIKRIHYTGQPILVGTGSVMESEELWDELKKVNINSRVLNAKNDEIEAEIIKKAGEVGSITISTNMAGRGVDIKLGGEDEKDKSKVASLGGLFVIGTNLNESLRIDNQLRGRAGRQGDPGESKFFISLEDKLIKNYEIDKLIPKSHYPKMQQNPISDPIVIKELVRGQRIVQGYNSDIRKQLWRYSFILEQQRRIIHKKREDILLEKIELNLFSTNNPDYYAYLCNKIGKDILYRVEKQVTLHYINKGWAEYLDYMAYIKESIHLVTLAKKDPLDEFHRVAIDAFDHMLSNIQKEILNTLNKTNITKKGIDMEKEGLKRPSSTWTYLIDDSPDSFNDMFIFAKTTATMIKGTLFTIRDIYNWFTRKKKTS